MSVCTIDHARPASARASQMAGFGICWSCLEELILGGALDDEESNIPV